MKDFDREGLSRRGFIQTASLLGAGATLLPRGVAAQTSEDWSALVGEMPAWQPRSDRKVRIGIVGGGFGLAWHWHEHPNCIVEAVSDLIPERRERLMGKYKCTKSYESLEKLILDPAIDAVAVFTPAPDHARHAILCMEHGKHVISACPACMSVEEAQDLVRARRRTGMRYMTAETSAGRWDTMTARRLFERGVFGEMVYCEGEYYHPGVCTAANDLSYFYGKRSWRYGFPPALYPTHSSAFLIHVTGERITHVSCIGTGDPDEPALKDNAYKNPFLNAMMLCETDKGHPFRCNVCWNIHADGERAQWFGTQAALYSPASSGQPQVLKLPGKTVSGLPDYFPMLPEAMRYDSGHGASHPFLTHEFIMALVEDREPTPNLEEALAYCLPGIIAHQSALKGGERLKVPKV